MSEPLEQKNGARTTQEVLTHHLNCFGDIAGTMADYSAEARFSTPGGLLRGSEAIRRFFVRLFEEFGAPLSMSDWSSPAQRPLRSEMAA
jgi:hypothetical protein